MKKSGFTLLELSVVLALLGVILYGSMSLLIVGLQASQVNATVARMDKIEKALLDYRVAFGRIPCPSNLTATASSANYGVEAANTGSCTGGSPAANSISASGVAEGGIPTRALNLPDDYMYDGWGRRFRYAVNPDYTVTSSTYCSLSPSPFITVNDASGVAGNRSTAAIYAIVSHGANGHGAYTRNGVVVNAGSTNADELTNCHCTNTAAAGTYTATYVEKAPTVGTAGNLLTVFDDIVTFREAWQEMTPTLTTNSWGCYPYYRTITINSSYVSTVGHTNLTNFPVLFSGTYPYLATQANGGNVTNANGYDITFTSDAAGTHLLPFERGSYNAATGAVVFWVQVPTVSASSNTTIYLQYGNPAITTDQSNKTGTWNSNYRGVWHLSEASGNPQDSTSYGSNGTIVGTVIQGATGVFGNAISINGGGDVDVPNPSDHHLDFGTGSFSTSIWVNETTTPAGYYGFLSKGGAPASQSGYLTAAGSIPDFLILICDGTSGGGTHYVGSNDVPVSNNTWYHVVQTIDTTAKLMHLYMNGVENSSSPYSIAQLGSTTSTLDLVIGSYNGTMVGKIQEIHVVSGAETPDWIVTEYNNQSSPGTFYTVGAQTSR